MTTITITIDTDAAAVRLVVDGIEIHANQGGVQAIDIARAFGVPLGAIDTAPARPRLDELLRLVDLEPWPIMAIADPAGRPLPRPPGGRWPTLATPVARRAWRAPARACRRDRGRWKRRRFIQQLRKACP